VPLSETARKAAATMTTPMSATPPCHLKGAGAAGTAGGEVRGSGLEGPVACGAREREPRLFSSMSFFGARAGGRFFGEGGSRRGLGGGRGEDGRSSNAKDGSKRATSLVYSRSAAALSMPLHSSQAPCLDRFPASKRLGGLAWVSWGMSPCLACLKSP